MWQRSNQDLGGVQQNLSAGRLLISLDGLLSLRCPRDPRRCWRQPLPPWEPQHYSPCLSLYRPTMFPQIMEQVRPQNQERRPVPRKRWENSVYFPIVENLDCEFGPKVRPVYVRKSYVYSISNETKLKNSNPKEIWQLICSETQ